MRKLHHRLATAPTRTTVHVDSLLVFQIIDMLCELRQREIDHSWNMLFAIFVTSTNIKESDRGRHRFLKNDLVKRFNGKRLHRRI